MMIEPTYETEPVLADDFEDGVANWVGDNATRGPSVSTSSSGVSSMKMTVTADGLAYLATDEHAQVTQGTRYRLAAQMTKAEELGARTGKVAIAWLDGAGAQIG